MYAFQVDAGSLRFRDSENRDPFRLFGSLGTLSIPLQRRIIVVLTAYLCDSGFVIFPVDPFSLFDLSFPL